MNSQYHPGQMGDDIMDYPVANVDYSGSTMSASAVSWSSLDVGAGNFASDVSDEINRLSSMSLNQQTSSMLPSLNAFPSPPSHSSSSHQHLAADAHTPPSTFSPSTPSTTSTVAHAMYDGANLEENDLTKYEVGDNADDADYLLSSYIPPDDTKGAFIFQCNNENEVAFTFAEPLVFGATKLALSKQEIDVISRGTPLWVYNRVSKTIFGVSIGIGDFYMSFLTQYFSFEYLVD